MLPALAVLASQARELLTSSLGVLVIGAVLSQAYNLDLLNPIVLEGEAGSHFGYSVSFHGHGGQHM